MISGGNSMSAHQRRTAASDRKEISYKVPTRQKEEPMSNNNNDQVREEVVQLIPTVSKFDNEQLKPDQEKKSGISFQCVAVEPS